MIAVITISDLSIYQAIGDLPVYDVFSFYDAATYKLIFNDVYRMYDIGAGWNFDLGTSKTIFSRSYSVRADYLIKLKVGEYTFLRATRFCDLYDKKLAGGSWNARETAEITAFCGTSTDMGILTSTYNRCITGIDWKEKVYTESNRLIKLVNAAVVISELFNLVENYPIYPL